MPEKRDFRQEVTDKIIQVLEQGTAPWQKPWDAEKAGPLQLPFNPTTGRPYRGGNAIHLMMTAAEKGYDDPRWVTYRQAQESGWQAQKGEKGSQIEFWQFERQPTQKKTTGSEDKELTSEETASRRAAAPNLHGVQCPANLGRVTLRTQGAAGMGSRRDGRTHSQELGSPDRSRPDQSRVLPQLDRFHSPAGASRVCERSRLLRECHPRTGSLVLEIRRG